jgi:hypothetical protein
MKLVLAVLFVALWATVNEPIPAGFDTVFDLMVFLFAIGTGPS